MFKFFFLEFSHLWKSAKLLTTIQYAAAMICCLFFLFEGNLKVRTSSVAPDTSREGPNNEEEYSEDPESIRSSDSEFY